MATSESPAVDPAGPAPLTLGPGGTFGDLPVFAPEDDAVAVLTGALGPAEADSGWVATPGCGDVQGERQLRWRDLVVRVQDGPLPEFAGGSPEKTVRHLAGWSYEVGVGGNGDPTLTTVEGVGLGSDRESLDAAYGDELAESGDESGGLTLELFRGDASNLLFVLGDGLTLTQMHSGAPPCTDAL